MTSKHLYFLCFALLFMVRFAGSQETAKPVDAKEPEKKLELKFYGFIKGDMFYSDAGVTSFGSSSLSAPQMANGAEQSALGFTAQHTRLGLRGTVGETIKTGGLIEIDFFANAFDANAKPRIRLGYASVAKGGFEVRAGQQWDLYSPNNATTNNTNANLWYAGNKGFRRAQIQLSYKLPNKDFSPMIQLSAGETSREEAGLGKDNLSAAPMLQGRLSATLKGKYVAGLSFVQGQYLEKKGTTVGSGSLIQDFTFNTTGFGVDFTLPVHRYLSLTGEVNTGTNLNNANLFSIAGNHYYSIGENGKVTEYDRKSLGYWVNATSKITAWLHVTAGYGTDTDQSETFKVGFNEKNTTIFGNLTFPVKHGFSAAVEIQNFLTTQITGVDASNHITGRKDMKANVISLSGKVAF